jgi:hypothetical protein
MKTRMKVIAVFLLTIMLVLSAGGCFKLFGPSDEEVVKAIIDTGLFSGGTEKFTLKSPIVIIEKGNRNSDGSWPVTVKMTVSFTMAAGREIEPMEKTSVFKLYKSKDNSGKTVWTAK